jgi:hypothetical protein
MARVHAMIERAMQTDPEAVYQLVRDYRRREAALTENFRDYRVEAGGEGAGTVVSYVFDAGRTHRHYRLHVDENADQRTLCERDEDTTFEATWSVHPQGGGSRMSVTCEWDGAGGVAGIFERTFAPVGLRRIYGQVLANLDQLASGRS